MLGILAGFGFLSRVTKHVLEKCNCLNYTEADSFVVLKEEIPQNIELGIQKIEEENKWRKLDRKQLVVQMFYILNFFRWLN